MGRVGLDEEPEPTGGTRVEPDLLGESYRRTITRFADPLIQLWSADRQKMSWAEEISPGNGDSIIRLITPKMLEIRSAAALFELGRGRRHTSTDQVRSFMEESVQSVADWYRAGLDHRSWCEDAHRAFVSATSQQ